MKVRSLFSFRGGGRFGDASWAYERKKRKKEQGGRSGCEGREERKMVQAALHISLTS